jgi:methionyl aminopeptidase
MTIQSTADLRELSSLGQLAANIRVTVADHARPGVTTIELDALAARLLRSAGAHSAPQREYGFPASLCFSVNDAIVHGVPGPYRLRPGDLLKIDVTIGRGGYVVDTACTVAIPPINTLARRMVQCVRTAFARAIGALKPEQPLRAVGRAVTLEVARHGFYVVPDLGGHGVGRRIHEWPSVPNFDAPEADFSPTPGLVLAVEPLIAASPTSIREDPDGWTLRTSTGALAAHHEHTVVVRSGPPLVLTHVSAAGHAA